MKMPMFIARPVALVTVSSSILLTSCEQLGNNSGLAALTGGALGAGAGALIGGKHHRGEGAIIGGVVGALAGFALSKAYQASQSQRALAEERGRRAVQSDTVRNSKAKYVAVPVPKAKGSSGGASSDLMVVNKSTGEPVDNKVYEVSSSSQLANGKVANIGGHQAVVYSRMQGV